MSDLLKLIKEISQKPYNDKEATTRLKKIGELAEKVIKKHKTLDVFDDSAPNSQTPLEAAARLGSFDAFKLLIKLGANPFFSSTPDKGSAIDYLAYIYFLPYGMDDKRTLFKWFIEDIDSPVFNWAKLKQNKPLFYEFQKANLLPEKKFTNELPLHVAVEHGRIDLIQRIVAAAGDMQKAGDIHRMGILNSAIIGFLQEKENAPELLNYLLAKGASIRNTDVHDLPVIMQVISAQILYVSGTRVKEEKVIELVQLLLAHGASLDVTNPNNGHTPLMAALAAGYKGLFDFFLDKADAKTINHHTRSMPYNLLFQLFDNSRAKLSHQSIIELLPKLKQKGMDFSKTEDYSDPTSPFNASLGSGNSVSAKQMSVLHHYVHQMKWSVDSPLYTIDNHLEMIQALIANGANPQTKALFILTTNVIDSKTHDTKKVETTMELTASQYLRKSAKEILKNDHHSVVSGIDFYQDEKEFLSSISYETEESQKKQHYKFHQFRNLERVLAGEKPLPYAGLPNLGKMSKKLPPKQAAAVDELDPTRLEERLIQARRLQRHDDWQSIKTTVIEHVKQCDSLQEFLTKVEQYKKPLQLHYDITMKQDGKVIYGSMMYRLFHVFNKHQFPHSWETLRSFGQDHFGVDINMQYEPNVNLSMY